MAGSVLAMTMQLASFAQNPHELINIDLFGQYKQTGAAALGLPGDVWNYTPRNITISPLLDAQGTLTTLQFTDSGSTYFGTVTVGSSPATIGLFSDYAAFGPMNFVFSGAVPDTNYLLVAYMTGDNSQYGGRITWTDGVITNSAETLNNPISTRAGFVYGQNHVWILVHSDSNGSIGNDGINAQTLQITGNSLQGWIPCWNGFQLQLAPDIPVTYRLPQSNTLFPGRTASFFTASAGIPPLSYQWQTNGVNITGATNPVLTIASVTSSSTYSLIVANTNGATTNSAIVSVVTPVPGSYADVANTGNPTTYWRLNENVGSSEVADYINGLNGAVGSGVTLGAAGVPHSTYAGFESANSGAQFVVNDVNSKITVPGPNLNTNRATITAWIKPNGTQNPGTALLMTRDGGGAGLNYGPTANRLGYTWNGGGASTYTWDSGLTVPQNIWSFVALVIEPTRATLYVFNTSSLSASINSIAHSAQAWSGTALLGSDPADSTGATNFNGTMDEVAVFARSLSSEQVFALFQAGLGTGAVSPSVLVPPTAKAVMKGANPQFSVVAVGSGTLTNQWQHAGTNISDNGHFAGTTTPTLAVNNVDSNDVGSYQVVVTGVVAPPATSTPVNLSLSPRLLLVNFDMNTAASPTYSGSAVLGQGGDRWNDIQSGLQGGLAEALGNPTSIGINTSGGASFDDATGVGAAGALMEDYRFATGSFTMTLSGLNNSAAYTVVTYNAGNAAGQGATLSGDLAGVATGDYRDPLAENVNYLAFTNVIPSASGTLEFTVSGAPGVLNGFQIMQQNISGLPPVLGPLQPASLTNYSGFPLVLSVKAASESAITSYQWKKDGINLSDNGRISGAHSASLSFNPLNTNDIGNYTVVVNNANGPTTSSSVSVTVLDGMYGFLWSPPVPITTAEETLLLPGQIVGAATFGGTQRIVTLTNANNMTVDFTADGSVATTTGNGTYGGGGFTGSGNTEFDQVMSAFSYDGGPKTITLNNLTPRLRYSVQFFGVEDRGCCFTRQAYLQDPVLSSDVSATWQGGDNVYVVGTITAADATQTFIEQLPGTPEGQNVSNGNATAVVIRLVPPTVSIVDNHNGTVTISWNQTVDGMGPAHLQSTTSLSGNPTWTDLGTTSPVTVPKSGAQFFRAVLP